MQSAIYIANRSSVRAIVYLERKPDGPEEDQADRSVMGDHYPPPLLPHEGPLPRVPAVSEAVDTALVACHSHPYPAYTAATSEGPTLSRTSSRILLPDVVPGGPFASARSR